MQKGLIMRRLVISLAVSLVTMLPACSSGKKAEQPANSSIPVKIGKTHATEDFQAVSVSGTIASPDAPSNVSFLVSGKVIQVGPREGEHVRKGQVLASIDPTDFLLALKTATAQVDMARATLEKAK